MKASSSGFSVKTRYLTVDGKICPFDERVIKELSKFYNGKSSDESSSDGATVYIFRASVATATSEVSMRHWSFFVDLVLSELPVINLLENSVTVEQVTRGVKLGRLKNRVQVAMANHILYNRARPLHAVSKIAAKIIEKQHQLIARRTAPGRPPVGREDPIRNGMIACGFDCAHSDNGHSENDRRNPNAFLHQEGPKEIGSDNNDDNNNNRSHGNSSRNINNRAIAMTTSEELCGNRTRISSDDDIALRAGLFRRTGVASAGKQRIRETASSRQRRACKKSPGANEQSQVHSLKDGKCNGNVSKELTTVSDSMKDSNRVWRLTSAVESKKHVTPFMVEGKLMGLASRPPVRTRELSSRQSTSCPSSRSGSFSDTKAIENVALKQQDNGGEFDKEAASLPKAKHNENEQLARSLSWDSSAIQDSVCNDVKSPNTIPDIEITTPECYSDLIDNQPEACVTEGTLLDMGTHARQYAICLPERRGQMECDFLVIKFPREMVQLQKRLSIEIPRSGASSPISYENFDLSLDYDSCPESPLPSPINQRKVYPSPYPAFSFESSFPPVQFPTD